MKALLKVSFLGPMPQPSRRGGQPFPTMRQRTGSAQQRGDELGARLSRKLVGGLSGGLAGLAIYHISNKGKLSSGWVYDEQPAVYTTIGAIIGSSIA